MDAAAPLTEAGPPTEAATPYVVDATACSDACSDGHADATQDSQRPEQLWWLRLDVRVRERAELRGRRVLVRRVPVPRMLSRAPLLQEQHAVWLPGFSDPRLQLSLAAAQRAPQAASTRRKKLHWRRGRSPQAGASPGGTSCYGRRTSLPAVRSSSGP